MSTGHHASLTRNLPVLVCRAANTRTPTTAFPNVYCSSCGQSFGPGAEGFSHCADHAHLRAAS